MTTQEINDINEKSFMIASAISDNYENREELNRLLSDEILHITTYGELLRYINPLVHKNNLPELKAKNVTVIVTDYAEWNKTSLIDMFVEVLNTAMNYCFDDRSENNEHLKPYTKKIEEFLELADYLYIDNPYLRIMIENGKKPEDVFEFKRKDVKVLESPDIISCLLSKFHISKEPAPAVYVICGNEIYVMKENYIQPFSKHQMAEIISIAISKGKPEKELVDILENYKPKEYNDGGTTTNESAK